MRENGGAEIYFNCPFIPGTPLFLSLLKKGRLKMSFRGEQGAGSRYAYDRMHTGSPIKMPGCPEPRGDYRVVPISG